MCITYFAKHDGCDHVHLVGSFNCGLSCTADRRHTFHLHDFYIYGCAECRLLSGQVSALDPDITPVEWQACTQDEHGNRIDPDAVEQAVEEQDEEDVKAHSAGQCLKVEEHEIRRAHRRRSAASLSDIDSETSEWRQDSPPASPAPLSFGNLLPYTNGSSPYPFNYTPKTFPMFTGQQPYPSMSHPYNNTPTRGDMTPGRVKHTLTVEEQLANLRGQSQTRPRAPFPRQPLRGFTHSGGKRVPQYGGRRTHRSQGRGHNRNASSRAEAVQPVPNTAGSDEFPALPGLGAKKQ